jgi:hypothetical protein
VDSKTVCSGAGVQYGKLIAGISAINQGMAKIGITGDRHHIKLLNAKFLGYFNLATMKRQIYVHKGGTN